jgi:uncharacterized protein with ATP-grasp and redox domains
MSGGHFNYAQRHINDIAESIAEYLKHNKYGYSYDTIYDFRQAIYALRLAAIYAQRIDWLLSGDDSEESFHTRLEEEYNELLDQSEEDFENGK